MYPRADVDLARRLERTEGRANAAFVEARARLQPEVRAAWIEVAGAYAMFDGIDSPLTQTFGLGLADVPVTDETLRTLEDFFRSRGAATHHETSPLAGIELIGRLDDRGYRPVEFTSVLYRPTDVDLPEAPFDDSQLRVRRIDGTEAQAWAEVGAEGWSSEAAELADFVRKLGEMMATSDSTYCFLAEIDERPIAAGTLVLGDDVALLAGASTVPDARRRGAQRALLEARLRFSTERGKPLAMMGAAPGSASQRNAERQGFRIAYTRTKWQLPRGGSGA